MATATAARMTGAAFRDIIQASGLSQREAADALEVSTRSVNRWANAKHKPIPSPVARLARLIFCKRHR